jgi:hypothetical protein
MLPFVNRLGLVSLILFLANGVSAAAPPFAIQITGPQNVKIGEDIIINITLQNISGQPLVVRAPVNVYYGNENYQIVIVDGTGVPVRQKTPQFANKKDEAMWASSPQGGSMELKEVEPGDTEEEKIVLNERYNISAAGTYLVRVSRGADDPGGAWVLSNVIRISVTQ